MDNDRDRLEEALRTLDRDIEPLRARCRSLAEFWTEFDASARVIQRDAGGDIWYAAAQLDRMLVRHGLMPRPGVFPLPRQQAEASPPSPDGGVRAA
jgi:hypothetical protein